jgi:hypothetical protein
VSHFVSYLVALGNGKHLGNPRGATGRREATGTFPPDPACPSHQRAVSPLGSTMGET